MRRVPSTFVTKRASIPPHPSPKEIMREVVIVAAARTPIGNYARALRRVRPDDMSALVLRTLAERAGVDPADIEDVVWGCSNQAGEDNRNVARMSVLAAGFPESV